MIYSQSYRINRLLSSVYGVGPAIQSLTQANEIPAVDMAADNIAEEVQTVAVVVEEAVLEAQDENAMHEATEEPAVPVAVSTSSGSTPGTPDAASQCSEQVPEEDKTPPRSKSR